MKKRESPYERFSSDNLILRDHLACDRTILANERTLLAYVRTALMLGASGVTLVKFFSDHRTLVELGYILMLLSFPLFFVGFWRYWNVRKDMQKLMKRR